MSTYLALLPNALAYALLSAIAAATAAGAQPWTPQIEAHELIASDHAWTRRFGESVAISGGAMLIGSPASFPIPQAGAAYVFRRAGGVFLEEQQLHSPSPANGDHFGAAVAIAGDVAAVSQPNPTTALHIYTWDGVSWGHVQTLPGMRGLGTPVLSLDVLAVPDAEPASVHVYRWNGSGFALEQSIVAPAGTSHVAGLAASGDALLVGLRRDAGEDTAAVYRWNGASWSLEQELFASDGPTEREFGASAAISGSVALVGAPTDNSSSGAVYAFRQIGGVWTFQQKLTAISGDEFGASVALAGAKSALVGAPSADNEVSPFGLLDVGAVYHYRWNGTSWVQRRKLLASNGSFVYTDFGNAIAAEGNVAVAGDPKTCTLENEDCAFVMDEGSAYVFDIKPPSSCGFGAELTVALALLGAQRRARVSRG